MRFALSCLLMLWSGATVSCGGRIPGLLDPARPAPLGDAATGGRDDSLTIADQAQDVRMTVDATAGSGGAGGDPKLEGTGGRGGAGGASGSTTSCSGEVVATATREPADVLLVLDRSGSMSYSVAEECTCDPTGNPKVVCADTVNCRTRWASLVAALDDTMVATPFLHWGLKLFSSPNAGPCNVTSGVEVPLGADATTAIEDQIAAIAPAGETPTASAITEATAYLKTQTDVNSKTILLATDGKPNCGGSPPSVYEDDVTGTINAITMANSAGFLVYIVGMGSGSIVGNLDSFAQAGGTDHYYPAQSPDDLTLALASISKAATCTFALSSTPPDPNWVVVYLDQNMVAQDTSNGWSFGASAQTILLHGSSCDQALAAPSSTVRMLWSCGSPLPPILL